MWSPDSSVGEIKGGKENEPPTVLGFTQPRLPAHLPLEGQGAGAAKGVTSPHPKDLRAPFPILRSHTALPWSCWSNQPWIQRCARARTYDSNKCSPTHAHVPAHNSSAHVQAHDVKGRKSARQGSRNGPVGQQLAPNSLGGVGETSSRIPLSKESDKSIQCNLNHVQSTDPWPKVKPTQPRSIFLQSLMTQCLVWQTQYTQKQL